MVHVGKTHRCSFYPSPCAPLICILHNMFYNKLVNVLLSVGQVALKKLIEHEEKRHRDSILKLKDGNL